MSIPPPSVPPAVCPNCGVTWPENAAICPNCGYIRPAAWPPPPGGMAAAPLPAASKLVTGNAAGDILLGLGLSLVSALLLAGLVASPILYFALRRQYPDFARGLGYGFLVSAALFLGALAICIVTLTHSSQNGG